MFRWSYLAITILLACVELCVATSTVAQEPFPPELTSFVADPPHPVFTADIAGKWDAKLRERGWVLFDRDAPPGRPAWRMWYTGYDGSPSGLRRLGLATSVDGVQWRRFDANPLSRDQWVEDMIVVPHQGTLYMFAEGRDDQAQLLTSTDGVVWSRVGPLDVRMTNGQPIETGPYGTPTVWVENDIWYLFYERRDAGVWLATSKDLKTWTHRLDTPVLSPGPQEYDQDLIAMNQIIRYGDRYYAYYHGSKSGTKLWSTCIATSTDLVHWTKYPANPLFPITENKSSGIVVHDGTGYRLYTMHNEVRLHRLKSRPD